MPATDGANRLLLVAVEVGDLGRDAPPHVRVEQSFGHERIDRSALAKRPRQADVGALQQRRAPRGIEREQLAHLGAQSVVGKGVGGELVAQEAVENVLGEDDGVERHWSLLHEPRFADRLGLSAVGTNVLPELLPATLRDLFGNDEIPAAGKTT